MALPNMAPLVPGWLSTHAREHGRAHFRRGQHMERMALGKASTLEQPSTRPASALNEPRATPPVATESPPTRTGVVSSAFRQDASQPAWLTRDRQVLRFFGYFVEPDEPSGTRVRRVVVCVFLADKTLAVSEPRVANSGIAQGAFLKRTPCSALGLKSPDSLQVGSSVKLCGQTMMLVDCDAATRSYFLETLGLEQAPPIAYPDDPTDAAGREVEALKARLQARQAAREASPAEKTRRFLELEGTVLRFFAYWRDAHPLYPETRRLVLHFFPSDDTVEVVEPRQDAARRGLGHFGSTVVLSRRRVPFAGGRSLEARDLRTGEALDVLGRKLFLADCDPFTRGFYLDRYGVTQEQFGDVAIHPLQVEVADAVSSTPAKWAIFRANGKDDDTNTRRDADGAGRVCRHAPTRSDALDGRQLRFRARFHGLPASHPDAAREFVLTFFLEDDTLAVFEPRARNAGRVGGRFLDRGRFRKSARATGGDTTSRERDKQASAYAPSDFFVGAIVGFEAAPSQQFELTEADEQTLAWCEAHPEQFPFSDADAALRSLVKAARLKDLRAACQQYGATAKVTELRAVLEKLGLNAQQALTLSRQFAGVTPGMANCRALCDAVAAASGVGPTQETPRRSAGVPTPEHDSTPGPEPEPPRAKPPLPSREPAPMQLRGSTAKTSPLAAKLRGVAALKDMLAQTATSSGEVAMDRFFAATAAARVELTPRDVQDLVAIGAVRSGKIVAQPLRELLQLDAQDGGGPPRRTTKLSSPRKTNKLSPPRHVHCDRDACDNDDETGDNNQDGWQPPASVPPLRLESKGWDDNKKHAPSLQRSTTNVGDSVARVASLLRRVFGSRKYQLRRALRDRDREKSGRLVEEEFMDALLSVEPELNDDDTYAIADAFFPTNNCTVDYAELLECAFRT